MVLYGSEIWGERAGGSRVTKQLHAVERPFLRAITRAYATAPTAALSVLAGCVPLVVKAGALYESRREWGERALRVNVEERPHPAIRGYMPGVQEAEDERIDVWVDACVKRDGRRAYAWVIVGNGEIERGGSRVEGELSSLEMEGWAVWKGVRQGVSRARITRSVIVHTDSEQTVKRTCDANTTWWIIGRVQAEIGRALERGVKVAVVWETRRSEGIHIADRECDRLVREGAECERVEGVGKGFIKKRRGEKEMREWQARWRGGNTSRWLYTMWDVVNREEAEVTSELVQVATGHGDFRAYLSRFRLNEGDSDVCDCESGIENVQHVVLDCILPRRVLAREELAASLGHYPPRLNEVRE